MSKMNNLFRYIKWCSLTSFVDFIQPFMTTLSAVTDDRSLYWVYWNHVRPSPESQPETSSLESHLSDFFLIMISWNEIFFCYDSRKSVDISNFLKLFWVWSCNYFKLSDKKWPVTVSILCLEENNFFGSVFWFSTKS